MMAGGRLWLNSFVTNRYLLPGRCPDCGAAVAVQPRCPSCGLVQTGRVADDLRAALQRADTILDVLRNVSAAPTPAPAAAPISLLEPAAPAPAALPAPPRPPSRRGGLPAVSVPVILLGLGTICVLVAAFVFVAVTWTELSVAWRTTILLAITALATASAVWVLRRRLRAAAEALTLVATGLLLIDLLAGNSAGLPVLSWLQGNAFWWLVTLAMFAAGLAWALGARLTAPWSLVGAQGIAALATLGGVWLAVDGWDYGYDWLAAILTVLLALVAAAVSRAGMRIVTFAALLLAVFSWLALAVLGLMRAVGADGAGALYLDLEAAPLLVASLLAAVVAAPARLHVSLRAVAAVLAVAGPVVVALLPLRDLATTPALLVVAVVALALVLAAVLAPSPWRHALRIVGAGTAGLPAFMVLSVSGYAANRVATAVVESSWAVGPGEPLPGPSYSATLELWSVAPLAAVVLATAARLVYQRRRTVVTFAVVGAAAGALVALCLTGLPVLVVASVVALAASAALAWSALRDDRVWLLVSGVLVVTGLAVSVPAVATTALFFPIYAGLLLAMAWLVGEHAGRALLTGGALALLAVSVEAGSELAALATGVRGLLLLLLSATGVGLAQYLDRRSAGVAWRIGLEGAAALIATVGLTQTFDDTLASAVGLALVAVVSAVVAVVSADRRLFLCLSGVATAGAAYQVMDLLGVTPAWGAVAAAAVASLVAVGAQGLHRMTGEPRVRRMLEATAVVVATAALAPQQTDLLALTVGLTLYGVAGVLVSPLSADRRRVAWAGSVLLVLASWVRLFALDVDVVEAYTLPGAVALLVVGLLWMRRTPSATSWQALGAALGLAVGPSLLVALQEPTSWRALLVGVVGLLLVGVGVRLTLGAPLLVGGVTVALLALVNIAPYAAGLPRWVLFGGAGVALLLLGVTWDRRRHDLVVAQRYATRLR
jgi:hypothetical protein